MSHVMFDLETWGTSPGCALRSIGAVFFDPASDALGQTFYRNISKESCLSFGLRIEPDTAAWWEKQSPEAVAALQDDQRNMVDVARDFHDWFRAVSGEFIWCHGANFDEPMWQGVCRQMRNILSSQPTAPWKFWNVRCTPWKFWNVRCTRTLYAAANFDPRTIVREGVAHNALDDAIYQARCVQHAWSRVLREERNKRVS